VKIAGATFGIVGALAAFPRRLAAREVERQGGHLRRGSHRGTTHIVFGRTLASRRPEDEIVARVDGFAGRSLLSENGFLRALGMMTPVGGAELPRKAVIAQSGLRERDFDLLALFDAFEREAEPFSFRDLILSKKYAGLIAGGATWSAVVRSIHQAGPVASLTALSLHKGKPNIVARRGESFHELDGQHLLPLAEPANGDPDLLFALAEEAEAEERFADAALLYGRCLALDPSDSVAAYNRGNCLGKAERPAEAAAAYMEAIKRDPGFTEAWFNYATLLTHERKADVARVHFRKAIALDGEYPDPVYNLAALELDAGNLDEARRLFVRYLELDPSSDWSARAAKGIKYVDLKQTADRMALLGRRA
jgi:tetratricopeptide (TPR) repeat protein